MANTCETLQSLTSNDDTTMAEDSNLDFSSRKHDPEYLKRLRKKFVKVELKKNSQFVGFVRSIDPISHSIILSIPKEDAFQTTLIPGHAIIDVLEMPSELQPPSQPELLVSLDQDVKERKMQLIRWFKKNLLPTSEMETKIVVGSVSVLPPYSTMDIYADNPVIVSQVRKLIEQMPDF